MRELKITHLYPELLNLYGDKGNIASLKCRAEWRDISVFVNEVERETKLELDNTDILFLGGGGDKELKTVLELLLPQKEKISTYVQNGGVVFAVCEGFPLLGKSLVIDGKEVAGLGILDITATLSSERITGNVLLECNIDGEKFNVTGFENRGLITEIHDGLPLGKVISGNGETDGIVWKNVFASALCGPLLPKNPKLADILLKRALSEKYGDAGEFLPLDDEFEIEASSVMEKRIKGL